MTPQSNFIVDAPIKLDERKALEDLLKSMNRQVPAGTPDTGIADPDNTVVPFRQFGALHFARFVIIEDHTLVDFEGILPEIPDYPLTLAFLGDCDGDANGFLADLADNPAAAAGLRRIFSHCEDFDASTDLLTWMKQHSIRPAASYVNWIGRTVLQVGKENKLRAALQAELARYAGDHPDAGKDVRNVRDHLVKFTHEQHADLIFRPDPTPIGWWIRNWLHFAIVPVLLLLPWAIAFPFLDLRNPCVFWIVVPSIEIAVIVFLWLLTKAPATFALLVALGLLFLVFLLLHWPLLAAVLAIAVVFALVFRWYEKTEPEVIPKPSCGHDAMLADLEDHDVSNQFTVVGSVKPSAFRRWLLVVILWATNYGARHIYNEGFLARIQTIHFAYWTFINDKRRVLFISNYDGSRHAYMDDFINKVGWGLNIIFGNGFGYPRTRWMINDGAKNELRFKDTNRRHQIPTQVWYKAYPGLTAFDLARNTRVRKGLQQRRMSDDAIRAWLREL